MRMDVSVSACVDVNNCHELHMCATQDLSVNKLGNDVTEFLNIQDDVGDPKPPSELEKKDEAIEKCFSTSSCSKKTVEVALGKESASHDNMNSAHPSCSHSSSLPDALKPVSAMKGSREKRGGTPPEKLRVKWAADVYDPVPTSVSHTVPNNRPQKQSKKSKQKKSSSSRGNKYKDRKQSRKRSSLNVGEKEDEFEFCGSSYLKRYDRNSHLSSVAEAT